MCRRMILPGLWPINSNGISHLPSSRQLFQRPGFSLQWVRQRRWSPDHRRVSSCQSPMPPPSARNRAKVLGWPEGRGPTPLPGFKVNLYADNLDSPRRAYVLPNRDVLIVESRRTEYGRRRGRKRRSQRRRPPSSNRITLLRDTDQNGSPELRTAFLTGLTNPYGVQAIGRLVIRGQH